MSFTVKITHIHGGAGDYEEAVSMARIELTKLSPVIDGVPQFDAALATIEKVRTKTTKNAITRAFTFR